MKGASQFRADEGLREAKKGGRRGSSASKSRTPEGLVFWRTPRWIDPIRPNRPECSTGPGIMGHQHKKEGEPIHSLGFINNMLTGRYLLQSFPLLRDEV